MDNDSRFFRIPIELTFAVFALFVSVNLIYIDIIVFGQLNRPIEAPSVIAVNSPSGSQNNQSCPQSCLIKIQEIATTPAGKPTSATVTPAPLQANTASGVREFFVPFGSGSGSAMDWEDVPGLAATINTANYTKLTSVTFEATLRIPTGNQSLSVRLYNATDKHPVWFSDIFTEGGTTKLVVSPAITLDSGNKTYQVQLKTGLGYPSYIDQSRLKLITQ